MPKEPLTETFVFRPLPGKTRLIERKTSDLVNLPHNIKLVESSLGGSYTAHSVTGVFQNFIKENSNRRIYPKSLWERCFAEGSPFQDRLKSRSVLGVLEHPEDGQTDIGEVSHVVTEVRFATDREIAESAGVLQEGDIVGTYETLPTDGGRHLAALHTANVGFGVSSRGAGNVVERNGSNIVEDDFDLDTWDVVTTPSVNRARPKVIITVQENKINESTSSSTVATVPSVPSSVEECDDTVTPFVKTAEDLAEMEDGFAGLILSESNDVIGFAGITESGDQFISEASGGPSEVPFKFSFSRASKTLGEAVSNLNKVIEHAIGTKGSVSKTISETNMSLFFPRRKSKAKPSAEPKTESNQRPRTPMSKYNELMRKKAEVVRLTQTRTEGMKPSDKAALLSEASQLRMEIDAIVESDPTIKSEAIRLQERLNKFESFVDEEAAPPTPVVETPPVEEVEVEDVIDAPLPPDVVDALNDAAATISDLTDGSDEEASALISELEEIASSGADEEIPSDDETEFVGDIPTELGESRNAARRFVKKVKALEAIHRSLIFASKRLLERNKSNRGNLGESKVVARLTEERDNYKEAAEQLAAKYNTDMIKAGTRNLQISKPAVYEAIKAKLGECKTWKQFVAVVNENAPAGSKKLAESTTPSADSKPTAPKQELVETHSAVQFVRRNRTNG